MFKISEATDKQIEELADLPEYEDRSHVVRDAVNKLHHQKIQ
jgi:Arc/MetJ-type ribon-helix-helix transcriptional regulator